MNRILILIPWYYPGYRSGGPQQTVANIVDTFGSESELYIITQDHDLGVRTPYGDIKYKTWNKVGKSRVMYVKSKEFARGTYLRDAYEKFSIIYSCGLFEKNTIMLLFLHRIKTDENKKIYVAPMGVFSKGALKIKYFKKKLFICFSKKSGLFTDIIWSFTSGQELSDAQNALGKKAVKSFVIAEDLPKKIDFDESWNYVRRSKKTKGRLHIVFLSRICETKNLRFCLEILNKIHPGEIRFDIYGVREDEGYWNSCKKDSEEMPDYIKVRYMGAVEPQNVVGIFREYDIFLFPTKGENFGHVIYEALAAGCIPVISDQTPWLDLDERGCGNVIALEHTDEFRKKVNGWLDCDREAFLLAKRKAVQYAREKYGKSILQSGYKQIFMTDS